MLKNEETQAMNFSLKQIIDNLRHYTERKEKDKENLDYGNVRISDILSNSGRRQTEGGVIGSEKEMELKIEVLNLGEKVDKLES